MASIGRLLWVDAPADTYQFQNNLPEIMAHGPAVVDPAKMKNQVIKDYSERIVFITFDNASEGYLVDGAILVKREDYSLIWKSYFTSCKNRRFYFGLLTVLSGFGAPMIVSNPMIQIALSAAAIGFFILAYINGNKASKVYSEYRAWIPLPEVKTADNRKEAYNKGFLYAYEHNLKLELFRFSCLLPCEVTFLFKRYFSQYCTEMLEKNPESDTEKQEWLSQFQKNNPLSNDLISYARTEKDQLDPLSRPCQDYNQLVLLIRNPLSYYRAKIASAKKTARQNLATIEEGRKKALVPFKKIIQAMGVPCGTQIAQAKQGKEKQQALESASPKSVPFNLDSSSTADLHQEFDTLKKEAEQGLVEALEIIEGEKKSTSIITHLVSEAQYLLNHAKSTTIARPSKYTPLTPLILPLPPIEERDFLAEAKTKFANEPKMLAYLNTPTDLLQ